jgi:GNAT superfamily N-acetyltransferase
MARAVPEMTLHPVDIERDHVEVLESDGVVLGFFRLQRRGACAWLEDLFIDPAAFGRGWGRELLDRSRDVARGWGATCLELVSDPNAEAFYRHLGAVWVGSVESPIVAGRMLPLMRLTVEERAVSPSPGPRNPRG